MNYQSWKTISSALFVALLSVGASADQSVEVIGGAITYHILDGTGMTQDYTQKITPDGRGIFNPMFGVRYLNEDLMGDYWSVTAFGGSNSVGFPMYGGLYSTGIKPYDWMYLGFVGGAYWQEDGPFRDLGIATPSIGRFGDADIIPVIGGELNFKVMLTKKLFIKENNLLSPILYNATLSVGMEF